MSTIRVEPDKITVRFDGEARLLEVLVKAGVPIAHLCGGLARCSTCRVFIDDGLSGLSERTPEEATMAKRLDLPPEVRLACQTTSSHSVRLRRLVLDKTDELLASQVGEAGLMGPVGREANVAVLFVDVVGYTNMSDVLPPFDIVHLLNRFFRRAADVIVARSGVVDNYMGDAVLAVFGLRGEPQPALSAVQAGLEILEVAREISSYMEMIYRLTFGVRAGVDFGEVVFGLLGAGASARETVIGDAVNVASRLEQANKEIGTLMLASDAIYRLTADEISYGRRHELEVRGKAGHVVAHEVIDAVNT